MSDLRSALTSRYTDIEVLDDDLCHLEPKERTRVDEASAGVCAPLARLLAAASRDGDLDREGRADLRALVRRMRRVVASVCASNGNGSGLAPETLQIHYRAVDLAARTRAICSAFDALAAKRRIRFETAAPGSQQAEVDPLKYEIVLVNLLFNAFKHTPEGGRVDCTLELRKADNTLVLSVCDSGPGVPAGLRHALFDGSRQFDRNVFLNLEGLGFSLGKSQGLVELHGGTLTLSGSPMSGAVFRATFPSRAPAGISVAASAAPESGLATRVAARAAQELDIESRLGAASIGRDDRPLVLLVEDNRSIQRVVIECLGPEYNPISAFDGTRGLELAIELLPDLLIADVSLPGMDGEEMIRAIRARPELADLPILVLTAADDPEQTVRLLRAGVQEILRKPILLAEVRARVHNLVAAKRARDVLNVLLGRHDSDLVRLAGEVSKKQQALKVALEEVRVARELAESASSMKSNFLRMVTHELKTPIAATELHLRLLERRGLIPEQGRLRDGVASITRCTRRLLHLVDTILEWARVESGRCNLSVEGIELPALVADVVSELATHATQKGLEVEVAAPPAPSCVLVSDRRLVRLILLNLIGRAIQVTDEGVIRVAVQQSRDACRVSVIDRAPPMGARQRLDLFEPLRAEVDLRAQAGSGSGLGLYVIRDIARAIDGNIAFEDREGPGNGLLLCLPGLPTSYVSQSARAGTEMAGNANATQR